MVDMSVVIDAVDQNLALYFAVGTVLLNVLLIGILCRCPGIVKGHKALIEPSSLLMFSVTLWLLGLTAYYSAESSRVESAMREARSIDFRPYLSIRPVADQISFNGEDQLIFPYQIKNTGRTPAVNVIKGHALYVLEDASQGFRLIKGPYVESKQKHFAPPGEDLPLVHLDVVGDRKKIEETTNYEKLRLAVRVTYNSASEVGSQSDFTIACFDLHPIANLNGPVNNFSVSAPSRDWGMNKQAADFSFC